MPQTTKKANATRVKRGHYKAAQATGEIKPGEVLDRDAFCKRLGTTRETVQEWSRMGLKITQLGKRRFIRAEDFDKFLASQPSSSVTEVPNGSVKASTLKAFTQGKASGLDKP